MPIRILRLFYHFSVYSIGIVVLLAAVAVSLIRLALPDIGIYRSEIEAWVSNYMGYPIAIHSVSATWHGWIPHLHLANIDLLNKAGTEPLTHFNSADISLNPIATLIQRRFVPRDLTISGFNLAIERLRTGAIYIAGISVGGSSYSQVKDNELADWLFSQERITIRDAQVQWKDDMHQQEVIPLTNVKLTMRSDGSRLQLEGSTDLPHQYGDNMDFAFDAQGNLLTSDWSGELYLHANNVNPDNWYRAYRPLNFNIAGGSADIRVWSSWNKARLAKVEGQLEYRNFTALIGNARLHIDKLGYVFDGERTDAGGWSLNMNLQNLVTQNGLWPEANLRVHAEPINGGSDMRYSVRFDFLKLDDLLPLISQLAFVPDAAKRGLSALDVSGELRNGRLIFDPSAEPDRRLYVDARFQQLSTKQAGAPARIDDASGRVWGNLHEAVLHFDHDSAQVSMPSMELSGLQITDLDGDVYWSKSNQGWQLQSQKLHLGTADLGIDLAGSASSENGGKPFLDLVAHAGAANLEKLKNYVPRSNTFHMRDWMDKAVQSGRMLSASAVLHGNMADFPFDDHSGQFEARLNVENTVLEYSPKWPPVDRLDAEILVQGRVMDANVLGGKIFSSSIDNANVHIADLLQKDKIIELTGRVDGGTDDLGLFIEQSPLKNDVTLDRLSQALTGGDMSLDLKLGIPLHQNGVKPEIDGRLSLTGAQLHSTIKNLQLSDIAGTIDFDRDSAAAVSLAAHMFDQPVRLSVSGTRGELRDPPSLTIHGVADPAFIADRLDEFFPTLSYMQQGIRRRLQGKTEWTAKLSFVPTKDGVSNELQVSSNLQGMAVDLPAPLGKDADRPVNLTLVRDLSNTTAPLITGQYGDILSCAFYLEPDAGGLSGAELHFGSLQEIARQPVKGIHFSGALHELPVSQWWDVLKPTGGAAMPATFSAVSADIHANILDLLSRQFKDVTVTANHDTTGWNVLLDSPEIAGTISLDNSGATGPNLALKFDRLYLSGDSPHQFAQKLDPRSFPDLNVDIADFRYDDKALGHMTLTAEPTADGLSIDHFAFAKPQLDISGDGKWIRSGDEDSSSFSISLHADRIDSMLKTFGYNVDAISKGETQLGIEAGWSGSPMQFSLANLNGTLKLQIKDGQLLEVDPKAGRLFGLLSIQTLPRRLSLDFSDLFSKGLAFDVIEGNFNISNGNAYTNDLYLRGPSAIMSVTGRTGLADKDYDQVVTVTPQIANTLPVASALFGPVGIGVGAVLYLAGEVFSPLHEGIDSLLQYQYTISGTWDNPVIEKYHGHNQANG